MDAAALLKSQGWRGKGHSLHRSDDSIGLAHPILFSQKQNVLGLGTTTHRTSDQWWMNAFDQQLKGMETTKDGTGIVQNLKCGELNKIQGRHTKYGIIGGSGLYGGFVRGGVLEGTIPAQDDTSCSEENCDDDDDDNKEHSTPATSEEPELAPENKTSEKKNESKEERRARKDAKKQRKAERAAKRLRKAEKKAAKAAEKQDSLNKGKEENRRRKEEKRRSKEVKEQRRKRKLEKRLKGEGKTNKKCQ